MKKIFNESGHVVCYAVDSHPMDSRFEIAGDIAPTVTSKLLKGSADGPLVLIEMGNVKCLNPFDDQNNGVVYAVEGNVVDRVSAKNGKGWCEDVSPTLNTQDRHAVVYALEGNGARPSHMGKGWSEDGTMYTLNTIEQHSVCYGISRSCLKGGIGSNGGMPVEENIQPSMTANGCGAVCYEDKR